MLKQTPFYVHHQALGAKMVPFAGYEMPLQYSGVVDEHNRVRAAAGLFDLSHMGEVEIRGADALGFLDRLLTNRFSDLQPGSARYTAMCKPDGGIIDDLIVYHLDDHLLLVFNAANFEKDIAWVFKHVPDGTEVRDVNDRTALLAIQGPRAQQVLSEICSADLDSLPYYGVMRSTVAGVRARVARTGYTGEDGFEIYVDAGDASALWLGAEGALAAGTLTPIGLAARDTLRLEMKYALYGNDIDESTTPLEAGLAWAVKLDKEFIGAAALREQKASKVTRRLVPFEIEGRGIPRPGHPILVGGELVGRVCSGTFSPSLRKGIGTGYVNRPHTKSGTALTIQVRGRELPARIVKAPFYKNGSVRNS
jgi:aminomethyltransferase